MYGRERERERESAGQLNKTNSNSYPYVITGLYRELGFFERLTAIEKDFPGANILLHKGDQLAQVSFNIVGFYVKIRRME